MCMAYINKNDQMRYIECGTSVIDYNNEDILLIDNVNAIDSLYPLKPKTTLIAMCTQGSQQFTANGRNMEVNVGDVLISMPNMNVESGNRSSDFECKALCLSDNAVQRLLQERISVWHHAVYVGQLNIIHMSDACKEEFAFYYALIRSKLAGKQQDTSYEILHSLLRALLLELCAGLERNNGKQKEEKMSQGKVLFNRFLSLISSSVVKRQPILYYAGKLAITPKYLTMLCLKYSNKTASDWVAQYTIEDIRFYLKSTDLSIKEIAAKLGFSNMSHFGSYVRKHLGMSPSEFRYSKKN